MVAVAANADAPLEGANAPAIDGDALPLSPSARPQTLRNLRAQMARHHDSSDGGGHARLDVGGPRVHAGSSQRWEIVYEAGALGIREGGFIVLEIPPFLGWSPPQLIDSRALGYVTASTLSTGIAFELGLVRPMAVQIRMRGRALAAGESVRIVYGAGPAGARADSSAERGSRFWIYVDGDGDGGSLFLPDSPGVDVVAGKAAHLHVAWPGTARPGDRVRLSLAVLDANHNAGVDFRGDVALSGPPTLKGPASASFGGDEEGVQSVEFGVGDEGVYRIFARGPSGLIGFSNPLVVSAMRPRILWGDLHGHSNFSDGTGVPNDFFRYARDVAGLDVAALTDHDHWGAPAFLDRTSAARAKLHHSVRRFHRPGRFVALRGYEWTSWLYGHRHVLYFGNEGKLHSSVDARYDTPLKLWDALRGRNTLTVAHHPAGQPIAINWAMAPDPELEPVTEIVSTHGSSEARDTPFPIADPIPGSFVQDALAVGHRLGFVGSSDSHDGHPGCTLGPPARSCGLAAIFAEELTRDAILEALRARRVYATNGPRILLWVTLDEAPMGSVVASSREHQLKIEIVAPGVIEHADLVRDGEVVERVMGDGARELSFERSVRDARPGETLYVRVIQTDRGAAWSSPFFID